MVKLPRTFRALVTSPVGRARNWCLVLALLFIPAEAGAHFHKAGAFAAASWAKGSRLAGFQLSIDFPVTRPQDAKNANNWKPMGIVFADVGANWGSAAFSPRTQATGMIGVRAVWGHERIQPFVHVSLASVHTQDSAARLADTASGLGVGGGLSVVMRDESHSRNGVLLRVQYDVVAAGGPKAPIQRYQRASVGIEFRFPRRTD